MNKQTIITILLLLTAVNGWAQEERIDTVIPKYLSNGYFFREMPQLPDGEMTMSKLKDKEGNSVIIINAQKIAAEAYHFSAIPYTLLFDPKGTILARGLRGEDIDKKLAEIFGNYN